MPLKLKLSTGDSKRTKASQPNFSPKTSSNCTSDGKLQSSSRYQRHHSSPVESVSATPTDDDFSPVFDEGNNNISPLGSPQSAPETWGTPEQHRYGKPRRPKSASEPVQPEELGGRGKESKQGRNRAFSVSRSGKFKEAKRRTSLLEIQDRFDKAAKETDTSSSDGRDKS